MKKYLMKFILFSGFLFFFNNCSIEPPNKDNFPSWLVELNVPLYEATYYADNLIDDSSFVKKIYQDDSIFAFQDTSQEIIRQEIGDQLKINNIKQSFSQSIEDITITEKERNYTFQMEPVGIEPINKSLENRIGLISLDDTQPRNTEPIVFTELIEMNSVPEGGQINIPQNSSFPTIYREFNFDAFEQARFSNGRLPITIHNELVIELGAPISIYLLNSDSTFIRNEAGDTAKAIWNTGIPSQSISTQEISLDSQTLPGKIIIMVSGVICGSGGQSVTNNDTTKNSSFYIESQAVDLTVRSATSEIPAQTIDTTNRLELSDSENKVKRAKIDNGNLAININNNLPLNATLELSISSLDTSTIQSGIQKFQKTIPISATQSSQHVFSLHNKSFIMELDDQSVSYNYNIKTLSTEPNKVQISASDQVSVELAIYGKRPEKQITFSNFTGQVAQNPIIKNGNIDITTNSRITSALIQKGAISIEVYNGINRTDDGVPVLNFSLPDLSAPDGPAIHIESTKLLPGSNIININNSNNSLKNYSFSPETEVISSDSIKQYLTYQSELTIPSRQVSSYDLTDSINVKMSIDQLKFDRVTGYFNRDPIVKRDSIAILEEHKLQVADISSGELNIDFINQLGAEALIDFKIPAIVKKDNGQQFSSLINLTESGSNTRSYNLKNYKINLDMKHKDSTQFINYVSNVKINSNEKMTMDFGENINANISLQNLKFNSIRGYIDTTKIELDTTRQEIETLPEELEGVNLEDVNIQFDLNTNIGVPLNINVTMKAMNSKGDEEVIKVDHTVFPDDPASKKFNIPNAESLINIKPDKLIAYGSAEIFGKGEIKQNQYVGGKIRINIPLIVEFEEGASFEMASELIKEEDFEITDNLEGVKIGYTINNSFDFGGNITVLAAKDTNNFEFKPDTLLENIFLTPNTTFQDSFAIDTTEFDLFRDSLYLKPKIQIEGLDGKPSKLLKNDSIKVSLWSTVLGKIDSSLVK